MKIGKRLGGHNNRKLCHRRLTILIDELRFCSMQVPIHAAYLYDAVNVYARALQEAIAKGIDPLDGAEIVKKIKGRMYDSELSIL